MKKDYKSFSSIAKSRFRDMANTLGYEKITGIVYHKERKGWYEGFSLQASQWGSDFYINYGVIVPNVWYPFATEADKKDMDGYWLSNRLHDDHIQAFANVTKDEVKESAAIALERYKEQAVPWFLEISGLEDIAAQYLSRTNLDSKRIGKHEYGLGLSSANYGLLLYKAGNSLEALKWLEEADRLYSLPVFVTREGDFVHKKEKYARILKPEKYELEQHETIKQVIKRIKKELQ